MSDRAIITSRIHGERVFERTGTRPGWKRRDGIVVPVAVWRSRCVLCGAPFDVTTPTTVASTSKAFERVHCETHKRSA